MAPIATYVFFDLETTGLPNQENNKTKITEFSMVAVKRNHVLDTRSGAVPRVQHKLTLLFNPGRPISTASSEITGLDNFLLEYEPTFNAEAFNLINNFLNILEKPVCLVAQNGLNFDYPILKNHLEKLNAKFSDDLLCADCYHGFYDILEARKAAVQSDTTDSSAKKQVESTKQQAEKETCVEDTKTSSKIEESNLYTLTNTLQMKSINETTPKQQTIPINDRNKVSKARRRMPFSTKPMEKYKLKDIYERVLNRPAIDAHRAENDCVLALEVSVALGKEFVEWVDKNSVLFSEVKPMRIGARLGD